MATSNNNTIVTACDMGYIWGVWLLIASIRKHGMTNPILLGAYHWSEDWKNDLLKFPGVSIEDLPITDKRSVTCSKPEIMLRAKTDFVTWIDCDGYLTGDCTQNLIHDDDTINIRMRSPSEVQELYSKTRLPQEPDDIVPQSILKTWQYDIGKLTEPRYSKGIAASVIGVSLRRHALFLDNWRQQMFKVLPLDVSVVHDGVPAYFQTDESVLNSLLLFDGDAPAIVDNYTMDNLNLPHFVHFAFNPKPWIMWNKRSFAFYDEVLDIIQWALDNRFAPSAPLPYSFQIANKKRCQLLLPVSAPYAKFRKYKNKLIRKLKQRS